VDERFAALSAEYALAPSARNALEVLVTALSQAEAPTAVHQAREALDVHIADSLAGLGVDEVSSARLVADLGSGAGLPGLVLAVALPDTRFALVESVGRKCGFISATAARMGLQNVEVVNARVEEWSDGAGACDVVTARALAALPVLFEYAAPILREGGVLVAWKGAVSDAEDADGAAAAELLGLRQEAARPVVPFKGSERRTLHIVRKVAPTPLGYPRRPGIATKRPLSVTNLR
jgi:16S rRNA (guanine527-N7)-methyltransferase